MSARYDLTELISRADALVMEANTGGVDLGKIVTALVDGQVAIARGILELLDAPDQE